MHPATMGALLFILLNLGFFLFLFAPITALIGFTGAIVSAAGFFTLEFIVYAWLVKKTGYKPTL